MIGSDAVIGWADEQGYMVRITFEALADVEVSSFALNGKSTEDVVSNRDIALGPVKATEIDGTS